jgi:hypothetical protein
MTFLTMLMTRLHGRLAQARAHRESGQELIEYAVIVGAAMLVAGTVYLVVGH